MKTQDIRSGMMRRAIAMIELIFAIVILGIVMMSAPMMVTQASQGSINTLMQEAVTATSAELGMIMTRHWDANNTDERFASPILVVNNGDNFFKEEKFTDGNGTGRRHGTIDRSHRTFLTPFGGRLDASTLLGHDDAAGIDDNDIDDFIGINIPLLDQFSVTNATAGDYVDINMTKTTDVFYIADAPVVNGIIATYNFAPLPPAGGGTTNVKAIVVTVQSASGIEELDKNITLRAFSCNIGSYELDERVYP